MDKPLHRLDGPAIDNYNGITGYFINDEHVSKEDFYNHPEVVAYKVGNIIKDILSGS